jgi:hypothetical protein
MIFRTRPPHQPRVQSLFDRMILPVIAVFFAAAKRQPPSRLPLSRGLKATFCSQSVVAYLPPDFNRIDGVSE